MKTDILACTIASADVAADGSCARLQFSDRVGRPLTLALSAQCLAELATALPTLLQCANQRQGSDDHRRIVHPLEGFGLETGELDGSGIEQFILTLHTAGGLALSYAASDSELATLANTLLEETGPRRVASTDG